MIANAGEHLRDLSLPASRVTNSIRRQQRQFQAARNFDYRMIARFFIAIEVALQLSINISSAKDINQPLRVSLCTSVSSVVKILRQQPIASSSQANQPFRTLRQFIWRHCTFAGLCMLRHAHFHQSDQTTKILIAGTIANE